MFFLFSKEEIKEFKLHSNFQQVSYPIKSITLEFLNIHFFFYQNFKKFVMQKKNL